MKKASSHIHPGCEQQLASALQLITTLQQTVERLQQSNQALLQQLGYKEQRIADQSKVIARQEEQHRLDQQTIRLLEAKEQQHQLMIKKLDKLVSEQLHRLQKNESELFDGKLLRYQWMQLQKTVWGRKSEKRYVLPDGSSTAHAPVQGSLFEVAADNEGVVHIKDVKKLKERMVVVVKNKEAVKHPGRHALPEHLERRVVKIEQEVPDGAVKIRTERTERLACELMEPYVVVEERDVYMMPMNEAGSCQQRIAPTASHPLPKCKADITLLVMLLIEKYVYHLPLYRIRQRFQSYGIDIPYNSLSNWVNGTIRVLRPLWELLWLELVRSMYMHMDETKYRVLDPSKPKGKQSHNGYLWVAGNPLLNIICYIYKKGRGKDEVKEILSGFKGYLHTDAYGGYDAYGRQPGVTHLHCMDHARRYFHDSLINDEKRSVYALDNFFAPLYEIERECKEKKLCYDEITEVRQQRAIPVLNDMEQWLTTEITKVIEGTPIYKAMAYSLKRMKQLKEYCNDGMLSISNMFVEQNIRPTKVGLKNYMFGGSHAHGELAAIIYSLVQTCKLQGIDPYAYFYDVLLRINDHKQSKLSELLPQNWKPVFKKEDRHFSLAQTA